MDAVVDTLSPATEMLGLLGDAVRLARVSVAAKITRKAAEIGRENGLTLVAPPLKFLVPFFEKASLEEEEDADLLEMWANLLASAGSHYQDRMMRFTSILSEMGSAQVRLFDSIARNYDGVISDVDEAPLFYDFHDAALQEEVRRLAAETVDDAIEQMATHVSRPGVCVEIIQIDPALKNEQMTDWNGDPIFSDEITVDLQILTSLGLLQYANTGFVECNAGFMIVSLYSYTELGFHFWQACSRDHGA